ncbi:hypothetical protein E5288_WYG007794 [Bos mutus]|uniref:Uncharacterized protein n=1 Tax=Bos mutus TaxID=72004 RepID=A0A6B0RB93_9CETA|nr:hypothetical protein [Bos mutus]
MALLLISVVRAQPGEEQAGDTEQGLAIVAQMEQLKSQKLTPAAQQPWKQKSQGKGPHAPVSRLTGAESFLWRTVQLRSRTPERVQQRSENVPRPPDPSAPWLNSWM